MQDLFLLAFWLWPVCSFICVIISKAFFFNLMESNKKVWYRDDCNCDTDLTLQTETKVPATHVHRTIHILINTSPAKISARLCKNENWTSNPFLVSHYKTITVRERGSHYQNTITACIYLTLELRLRLPLDFWNTCFTIVQHFQLLTGNQNTSPPLQTFGRETWSNLCAIKYISTNW